MQATAIDNSGDGFGKEGMGQDASGHPPHRLFRLLPLGALLVTHESHIWVGHADSVSSRLLVMGICLPVGSDWVMASNSRRCACSLVQLPDGSLVKCPYPLLAQKVPLINYPSQEAEPCRDCVGGIAQASNFGAYARQ